MSSIIFNKNIYFYIIFILVIPTTSIAINNPPPDKILKVGVRALKGSLAAKKSWTQTINVLSQKIKGYQFELVPIIDFHEMVTAVKNKKIDFVLTNPLTYIELNQKFGITRILTLNKKQPNGIASTRFSAVIFTRSDRNDIHNLQDLYNKSIMGVYKEAFGGWRMALRELLHHNFDPYKDSSEILFSADKTHQSVVYSVLAGDADVGTVRTGIIEQLVKKGKIKSNAIKVLNPHKDKLSALHSTQHYPEWPFAVMPHISSKVLNDVFNTLLSIKPESSAANAGNYVNWIAPLDYGEIYNLLNELEQHNISFSKIWDKHWLTILILHFFIFAIVFYTLYLFSINKKLQTSELALSGHREHLEDIVEKRTAELTEEKVKADKANKAKSEFLSNMSHELRTPLNAVLGFSHLIKMDAHENEEISDHADEIISAGDYLLSLINEILDLAKIESGKAELNLKNVLFNNILNLSLDIVSPIANKKNITTNFNNISECHVMADSKRLQQVCINLLSNAIKYNKTDGTINITLEKNDQNLCKLSIKDSGIGIKPKFYDKVFQPFVRDSSNADVIEGTGVGLVITKHLVEQMQGEIGFNSEYGIGTEFWVTFPAL